jgi:hypothetical protein
VGVEKKNSVGADVLPVDSSGSEDRMAVGLLPDVQESSPQSADDETAEDEPEQPAALVKEPDVLPEEPDALPEEPAAPDHTPPHYPTRDRKQPNWSTFDENRAAVNMCAEAPSSHVQALASSDASQWRQAMDEEMASLHSNGTWDLQLLPPGRQAVACRLVFTLKCDAKGEMERYKARLVAKGFSQKPGVDYGEVWAPVSKYKTLRILLAVVATEDLHLHQLDIKTAFLNGIVEEELYMQQPPGYAGQGDQRVCRLRRALYGLKQASRTWHLELKDLLCGLGFEAVDADPCLFVLKSDGTIVFVLVYVDDMLTAASTREAVECVKRKLLDKFEARDMGEAGLFLGMSLVRDRNRRLLLLHQGRYAREVVARLGMTEARAVSAPMARETKLHHGDLGGRVTDRPYAEVVGSLMYLMTCTWPDLAQSVGALSRSVSDSRTENWEAAVKVLRNVVGTLDIGLQFGGKTREVTG